MMRVQSRKAKDSSGQDVNDNASIESVFAEENEIGPVLDRIARYREWAVIHSGTRGGLKSVLRDTPYFTSDTSVGRIRSHIASGSKEADRRVETRKEPAVSPAVSKGEEKKESPLVFLRLAQEQDAENERIDTEFTAVIRNEQTLFERVKGEDASEMQGQTRDDAYDPGSIMTEQRIKAWAWYLNLKKEILAEKTPLLLTTTSQSVIDTLEEMSEKKIISLDIKEIIAHEKKRKYADFLKALENCLLPGTEKQTGRHLKLFLFSESDIKKNFCLTEGNPGYNKLFQVAGEGIFPVILVR
ncbi:MAG: hypothetical protein U9P10_16395 [Thermodesulfobacteriota bacterium]|nr:hypothetical protein [Thermodesulfobacteriota bacterium]